MIQLSLLTEDWIDEILLLEQTCFPEDPWGRISFENELTNPYSVFVIAVDDASGQLVAYGGVWLMVDAGNITNIAVAPSYRREGIGTKILDLLTQICMEKGMETITLEVRESNLAAQSLYASHGFLVCGRRKLYYQGKEDAIIMTKEFKKETNSCEF